MDSTRTRRVLIVAFVLSLLIHVAIATGVRWKLPAERNADVQIVRLDRMHQLPIARRTSPPTPPPTPQPTPSRAPKAQAPKSVVPARPRGARTVGSGTQNVAAATAPSALPRATATPSCLTTDIPATVASAPPVPEIAPGARATQTSGVARVQVTLDESGAVKAATLVASSGNAGLDAVAAQMARDASYAPARHACKAVASEYVFSVRFSAW